MCGKAEKVSWPKTLGACGPSGLGLGTSQGTPFTMIPTRLFQTFSFFHHPGLVKRDFFKPMVSLGVSLENGEGMKPYILVELNPNMLDRDVERMGFNSTNGEGFMPSIFHWCP